MFLSRAVELSTQNLLQKARPFIMCDPWPTHSLTFQILVMSRARVGRSLGSRQGPRVRPGAPGQPDVEDAQGLSRGAAVGGRRGCIFSRGRYVRTSG